MSSAQAIVQAYPKSGMALAKEIVAVAKRTGAHPYDLANLINFESAGTFKSDVKNPVSGATGLIQFMPKTAIGLGTTTAKLAQLSPVAQMAWVEKYLKQFSAPKGTVQGLYMSVFYPKAMRWELDREFPKIVQRYNPGITTVRDYVALATRNAKLPSSKDVGEAKLESLPFAITRRAAVGTPLWVWIATAVGIGTTIVLLLRRR